MGKFKGTTGHIKHDVGIIFTDDYFQSHICNMSDRYNDQITDMNANLIVDAFNVRQQIDCDLPELKRQRDEMLEMLERVTNTIKHLDRSTLSISVNDRILKLISNSEHIIKSAKQS